MLIGPYLASQFPDAMHFLHSIGIYCIPESFRLKPLQVKSAHI